MEAVAIKPDERALRADLGAGAFQLGVANNRWRIGAIEWPFVQVAVAAAERAGGPAEYWFRFDCTNYPQQAPTARLWDAAANAALPVTRWPTGRSLVPSVFRTDWQNGTALYLPCDRVSAAGHENWRTEHASYSWSPAEGMVLYLRKLYELLNSNDYAGVRNG